jgi:tripartite-type tricarboxylate transporter receptor subunit TctC
MNKPFLRKAAMLAALVVTAAAALAQSWPSKPVILVVPWPAGGPTDFVARQVQNDAQKALGQPVVIENVGGVGGALGVQKVLSSTDGHALLLGSPDLMIPPLTIASVKYKATDLRMVAQLVRAPLVLVARKDLPANSVDELLALAAQRKDKPLTIANNGAGSMFHLVAEKFSHSAGIELLHIPYRGYAPAFADLMGGKLTS